MVQEHWVKRLKKQLEELNSKVEELNVKVMELEKEKENYRDLFLRKAAEFENYKKLMKDELQKSIDFANEEIIRNLTSILDHFRLALNTPSSDEVFRKGVEMIYNELLQALRYEGLEVINSLGCTFDENFHEAIDIVETDEFPPGTVVEEVQPGYVLKGKVIRPARVKVSKKKVEKNHDLRGDVYGN
ncbi:MAG TPA: nucleotide exchange factor GrpE [Candidatus Hydrothermia bacterium]|nr:nucleotide exchange factor GrpE [Candidatus Hydrothermia bacterium]HOP31995.1 nucleotide exchange factor GrpE [Candidatus Hydrothermia bacterium]